MDFDKINEHELDTLTITKLRKLGSECDIENYKTLSKAELVNEISCYISNKKGIPYNFGKLEILNDSYGFLRSTKQGLDVYISLTQIKKFNLRNGDIVAGLIREPINDEKSSGLTRVSYINGDNPEKATKRQFFDDYTPIYPREKLKLEKGSLSSRIIDLLSPIGKGQRALIVAPPKAGKTVLLSTLANDIIKYNKDVEVWILLIDERPEEVTDIKENVPKAKVFSATFDEDTSVHIKVAEEVLENAKKEVEANKNIVILMDSITRLTRSYNVDLPTSGKILSGGLDPKALYMPKKFLGSARNILNGGSLTIIATALIETGSRMDDVIFEELKGTGNSEIVLDRSLQLLRLFPAIDIQKSGTRKEEFLFTKKEMDIIWRLRKILYNYNEAEGLKYLMDLIKTTKSNEELLENIEMDLK